MTRRAKRVTADFVLVTISARLIEGWGTKSRAGKKAAETSHTENLNEKFVSAGRGFCGLKKLPLRLSDDSVTAAEAGWPRRLRGQPRVDERPPLRVRGWDPGAAPAEAVASDAGPSKPEWPRSPAGMGALGGTEVIDGATLLWTRRIDTQTPKSPIPTGIPPAGRGPPIQVWPGGKWEGIPVSRFGRNRETGSPVLRFGHERESGSRGRRFGDFGL